MRRPILLALTLFAAGCGAVHTTAVPPRVTEPAGEWVGGSTELRKITAIVRAAPPPRLRAALERVASRSPDPDLGDFLRAHASGGFGSGFLVVHRTAAGEAAFVVTNRHVIAGADTAEIEFGDGTTYKSCEIAYANPKSDVAIVALPESAIRTFGGGLVPAASEVRERLTVVATGYPGVDHKPSFQMTEGKISNARFTGMDETVLQHTAPIDPGSSGGPLTNEAGELVGVNVAMIRERSSMFFAVPASSVTESVRYAHELVARRRSAEWMSEELGKACGGLAAELASHDFDGQKIAAYVSNDLVAEEGFVSFAFASTRPGIGRSVREAFYQSPIGAMRGSVVVRVMFRAAIEGGATGRCGAINPADAASIASDKPVRLALQTKAGEMELRWRFDQGSWRVVGGDLLDVEKILTAEQAQAHAEQASTSTRKPSRKPKAGAK